MTIETPAANMADLLIGTLIEEPWKLARRPPLMKRMCRGYVNEAGTRQECGLVLGWEVCLPREAGQISPGICEGCVMLEIQVLADARANARGKKL